MTFLIKSYFGYPCALLLKGDGANNSSVVLDSSLNNFSIDVVNAVISTDQSNFGGSSIFFNNSRVSSPRSDEFNMGTGDFTAEAWIYPTSVANDKTVFDSRTFGTGFGLYCSTILNPAKLVYTNNTAIAAVGADDITINAWNHVAVSRESGTVRGFLGGSLQFTVSDTRDFVATDGGDLNFRIGQSLANTQPYAGYIDEARITKGAAIYTAPFTPPVDPFI